MYFGAEASSRDYLPMVRVETQTHYVEAMCCLSIDLTPMPLCTALFSIGFKLSLSQFFKVLFGHLKVQHQELESFKNI